MSFKDFKKNRTNLAQKLTETLEQQNANPFEDKRFWQPTVDKAGNGVALIRYLPAIDGESIPYIRLWSHAFKGSGGWFMNNCPTTKNEDCPVCAANTVLWNSGIDDNKAIVSGVGDQAGRKRKLTYISNIIVLKDTAHPENEGKVFLYKYGAKIFDKIQESHTPAFADSKIINPFDMWEGANFKLSICKVKGYRNYDKSTFETPGQLDKDEAKMEAIYNSLYSLQAFVAPEQFKSFEDLEKRFNKAVGNAPAPVRKPVDSEENETPVAAAKPAGRSRKAKVDPDPVDNDGDDVNISDEDSDAKLAMFQALAD